MARTNRQEDIQNILPNLRGLEGLKRLFWEELNYERENWPLVAGPLLTLVVPLSGSEVGSGSALLTQAGKNHGNFFQQMLNTKPEP